MGMLDEIEKEISGVGVQKQAVATAISPKTSDDWNLGQILSITGTAIGGLSRFEREQERIRQLKVESLSHAWQADEREWGWFPPGEWFELVERVKAFEEQNKT